MKPSLKDSFIPHEENNYLPHFLRRAAMLGMLGMVLLSFLGANLQALLWQSSSWLTGAVLPSVVVELTNEERGEEALPQLVRNPILDAAAQLKAEDMASKGYFAHYSPAGVSPWHWFNEVNYSFVHAGENLAVHFSDSGEVVDAWMDSPTHRANIVNGNYREIGVGTARGTFEGYDTVFVVQLFGTPAAAPAPVAAPPDDVFAPIIVRAEADTPSAVVEEESLAEETVIASAVAPIEDSTSALTAVAGAETEIQPIFRENEPTPLSSNEGDLVDDELSVVPSEEVDFATLTPVLGDPLSVAGKAPVVLAYEETSPIVAETVIDESMISVYSTFAASSTNLAPAPEGSLTVATSGSTPYIARLATEPSRVLQMSYMILGSLVALALFLSVSIEWKRQHPRQVAFGVLLLLLMSGLFYLHMVAVSGALVV